MAVLPNVPADRFLRRFDKAVTPGGPFSRFVLARGSVPVGSRRGKRFFFYLRRNRFFSLFSATLRGALRSDGSLCYSVSRPRPLLVLVALWSAFLCYTAALLVTTEPEFAALFFLLGALPLPFAFIVTKKEKARLTAVLESLI